MTPFQSTITPFLLAGPVDSKCIRASCRTAFWSCDRGEEKAYQAQPGGVAEVYAMPSFNMKTKRNTDQ